MSHTAISRNTAQNIPSSVPSAFPSAARSSTPKPSLARLSPIPQLKRPPSLAALPAALPDARSGWGSEGPVPPASSFGAGGAADDGVGTFHVGNARRDAPVLDQLPQVTLQLHLWVVCWAHLASRLTYDSGDATSHLCLLQATPEATKIAERVACWALTADTWRSCW